MDTDPKAKKERRNDYEKAFYPFYRKPQGTLEILEVSSDLRGTSIIYFVVYYLCEYVFFKHLNGTPVTDNPVLSFLGIQFVGTACSYFIASFCSFAASYVINRKVTFKSNSNILFSTILYTIMTVLTVAFTTWFGAFMKTVLYKHNLDGGILEVLMPCVVMCIPFLWTYPLQRFVIYKNKNKPDETEDPKEAEEQGA